MSSSVRCYIGLLFAASLTLLVVYWCILTNEWKTVTVSVPIITIPLPSRIGNEHSRFSGNVTATENKVSHTESIESDEIQSVAGGQTTSLEISNLNIGTSPELQTDRGTISDVTQRSTTELQTDRGTISDVTQHSTTELQTDRGTTSDVTQHSTTELQTDRGTTSDVTQHSTTELQTGRGTTSAPTQHSTPVSNQQLSQVTSPHTANEDSVVSEHSTPGLKYNTANQVKTEMLSTNTPTSHSAPRVIVIPKGKRSTVVEPQVPAAESKTTTVPPPPATRANQQTPGDRLNQPSAPHSAAQSLSGNRLNQLSAPHSAAQSLSGNRLNQPSTSHSAAQSLSGNRLNQPSTPHSAAQSLSGNRLNQFATPHSAAQSTCREPYCLDHLNDQDRWVYRTCLGKLRSKVPPNKDLSCRCKFMDGAGKKLVALVSLPGSGNTWVRGLLQKTTGVCTGSIYCDKSLRAEGFCGEGLRGSSLLTIKTHDTSLLWKGLMYTKENQKNRPFFDAAIFIIRDPFAAAISEWNREKSSQFARNQNGSNHVKYVDTPKLFGENPLWDKYARYHVRKWRMMIFNYIIRRGQHPILVVRYEDIKTDTLTEVKRMLDFLKYPYSDTELQAKLKEDFTTFYRNHTYTFDHFTASQREYINDMITGVALSVRTKTTGSYKLEEYVRRL